jgi:hypothetical protein
MPDFQNTHQAYLYDLAYLLKVEALEALAEWRNSLESKDPTDKVFFEGQLLAYYKVLDLMKSQAESFELAQGDLNWDDFDPDTLLPNRK